MQRLVGWPATRTGPGSPLRCRLLWGAGAVPSGPGALRRVCPSRHGETAVGRGSACSHSLSPEYRPGGGSWPDTTPHLTSRDAVACLPRALAPTLGSGCGVLACGTRPPRARWPSLRARCRPQPAGVPGQTRAAALPRPVDRRARGSTAGHSEVQLVFFLLSVTSESDPRQHCLSSRHGGLLSSFLLRT